MKRLTTEEFIHRANLIHNSFYNYSNTIYTKNRAKVIIVCPIHGNFEQKADSHLQGNGCHKCSIAKQIKTNEYFISKANLLHNNKYNYKNVKYTQAKNYVSIICPEHGAFKQQARNHLQGVGCPACAIKGFDQTKPAYLYYLKITTEGGKVLYKIGITNRTVNERFSLTDLSKIEIVKQKLYEDGSKALEWETKLKRKYKEYQYKGPAILENGNTELFIEDIMSMWYKE